MEDRCRYFVTLSYDGTKFLGWQIQPKGRTVQGVLEEAFSKILRMKVSITGAGRTDTGVHARYAVAHFDLPKLLGKSERADLTSHLNRFLPADISLFGIYLVDGEAHARFDATSRRYRYYVGLSKDPFTMMYETRLRGAYDFESMNEAAKRMLGTHDFTTLSKKHTDVKTHICTIYKAEWVQVVPDKWYFEIIADRFLRNMVRATVGTLFMVGRGKMSVDEFEAAIVAKDRSLAGTTAPAEGLFLEDIVYPFELKD